MEMRSSSSRYLLFSIVCMNCSSQELKDGKIRAHSNVASHRLFDLENVTKSSAPKIYHWLGHGRESTDSEGEAEAAEDTNGWIFKGPKANECGCYCSRRHYLLLD